VTLFLSPTDPATTRPSQDARASRWRIGLGQATQLPGPLAQIGGTVLLVVLALALSAALFSLFGTTRLSMVFLGSVLLAALAFGARAGMFGALLAFTCYNFTLTEPRFSFEFAGPEDVLTLTLFLAVALTTGGLAGRVRESQRAERERADQLAALLEASQAQTATDEPDRILADLQQRLATVTRGPAVVSIPGARRPAELDAEAWGGLDEGWSDAGTTRRSGLWRARRLGSNPDAPVAAWRSADPPEPRTEALCDVLVDLAAVSLERARLGRIRSRTEADRQAAALRDAVLASLSHDLRTPLASILASSTSLRDYEDRFDLETRRQLIADIISETDRLNRYVGNLLNLTRIQAGALRPTVSPVNLADVLDQAGRRAGRPALAFDVSADNPLMVEADPLLLEQVMFNVIDNALTHAGHESHINVEVTADEDHVALAIIDDGPGVPPEETGRIFETFTQVRATDGRRGAGIGLSVARGFIAAMGGAISAGPRRDGASGLVVTLRLKRASVDG
jgi:two-component system, OmpR family, sensor histidine kinase KdpD